METPLIIANFKSNMTLMDAQKWLQSFSNKSSKKVIILPPFTLLSFFRSFIENAKIKVSLGSQNVSQYGEGAYTGEVNAKQVKDYCEYVLIGHSERRKYFSEKKEDLAKKVEKALESKLVPIYCVQGEEEVPQGIEIVAYEPTFAIGTGNPDSPENAQKVSDYFKKKGIKIFLYGGSVNSMNVGNFTKKENIDGVLVGGASLDPQEFKKIIENA